MNKPKRKHLAGEAQMSVVANCCPWLQVVRRLLLHPDLLREANLSHLRDYFPKGSFLQMSLEPELPENEYILFSLLHEKAEKVFVVNLVEALRRKWMLVAGQV